MKYYIFSNNHVGVSYDDNLPEGAVECDESVYENAAGYSVVNDVLVAPTIAQLDVISIAEKVAANESQKASLLAFAQSKISLWQTELLLGTISDTDKASLTSWVTYIKALNAIDTSATGITWPTAPNESSDSTSTATPSSTTTTSGTTSA